METGSQILQYTGNQALGLGSNPSIPAIDPKANLDTINQTSRDILLQNHQNNILLYDQKIKDRNETLKLLADGQVGSGDIDPSDRPVYEKAKQAAKDSFFEMIQNGGLNNPNAVKNYQDKVTDLYNTTVHAQSRQLEYKKLELEKTNQVLPEDISMYDNHINQQRKKDFWQPIDPLQKAFSLNLPSMTSSILGTAQTQGAIGGLDEQGLPTGQTQWHSTTDKNGVVTNKTTTKTTPFKSAQLTNTKGKVQTTGAQVNSDGSLSAISYTPEKYWDFPTMLKNAQEQYISDPTQRENQNQWLQQVTNYDDTQKVKLLQAYNNRIADYSKERGIAPTTNSDGSISYPDQIKYAPDPTGKIQIQETPSSFAAKHTLASIEGNYVEKPQGQVDYKILENQTKLKELAQKASYDKGRLSVEWANYGLAKKRLEKSDTEDLGGANTVLQEAVGVLKNGTPVQVVGTNGTKEDQLRISDPSLLQTFGKIDKDGNTTEIPDAMNYNPKTNQVTLLYGENNRAGGLNVTKEIPLDQRAWLKLITKRSFPNKDIGTINSLLEDALTKNGNSLYDLSKKVNTQTQQTAPQTPSNFNIKGKSYTKDDLNKLGYTDDQINNQIAPLYGIKNKVK